MALLNELLVTPSTDFHDHYLLSHPGLTALAFYSAHIY